MATLSGPTASYSANGWFVSNDIWDTSVLGRGGTLSGTYDPSNLTANLTYTWNFGPIPSGTWPNVSAYPELAYGQDPWSYATTSAGEPYPFTINSIQKYDLNYSLSWGGQTPGYNVAFEMYLTSSPGGGPNAITNEVMVWVHTGGWHPGGSPLATYTDGAYSAQIYSYPVYEAGLHFNYTAFVATTDDPSDSLDLGAILKKLVSMGIVSGDSYVNNIQVGSEISVGTGYLTVNDLQLDIQTAGNSEQLIGTPPPNSGGGSSGSAGAASGQGPLSTDFNGDGISDLLWTTTGGQGIVWEMNGANEIAASAVIGNYQPAWHIVGAADFNGDGKADVLRQNSDGQAAIWIMDGLNRVSAQTVAGNPGPSWRLVGSGDYNGDNKADLLWQNGDGKVMIYLMNGVTQIGGGVVGNPGADWQAIGPGDFNGDGMSDILFQNDTTGQAMIWTMNGTTVTNSTVIGSPGAGWHAIGWGDFDNDGKADILWQNDDGQAAIWLVNGTSVVASANVGSNPGPSWTVVGAGDFNGDGKSDILWQSGSGQAMVWIMNGLSVVSQNVIAGSPGTGWHAVA